MSKSKNTTALYARIPEELKHKLDLFCVKNRISIQDIIIQLLENFVAENDKK